MALTLLIVPGYQLVPGELVTTEKLNQLATPTIQVLNDSITFVVADDSVTAQKLADGALAATETGRAKLADGYFTSDIVAKFAAGFWAATAAARAVWADGFWSNGAIAKFADGWLAADATSRAKMADGFVTALKLEPALLGSTDIPTGTPAKDDLVLWGDASDETTPNKNSKATVSALAAAVCAESGEYAIPAASATEATGTAGPWTHGLGAVPRKIRCVCRCVTADKGYAVGDEVEVSNFSVDNGMPVGSVWASSTQVGLRRYNNSDWYGINRSTGAKEQMTQASWRLKFYAGLY